VFADLGRRGSPDGADAFDRLSGRAGGDPGNMSLSAAASRTTMWRLVDARIERRPICPGSGDGPATRSSGCGVSCGAGLVPVSGCHPRCDATLQTIGSTLINKQDAAATGKEDLGVLTRCWVFLCFGPP